LYTFFLGFWLMWWIGVVGDGFCERCIMIEMVPGVAKGLEPSVMQKLRCIAKHY
jgi:hypothetical protein